MMRCPHPLGHEDAAKRCADNVNMHFQAGGWDVVGKWCAIALQDGSSDHVLYERRRDAVLHQHHNEQRYCFVRIVPAMMGYCEAQVFIDFHRKAYDAGFRLADPEHRTGGREIIVRGRAMEKVADQLKIFNQQRRS
jgi:hypothetical protein